MQSCRTASETFRRYSGSSAVSHPKVCHSSSRLHRITRGASHSSCMSTDVSVGGKSGTNVDFIRSLLVAEADEVFIANFGHGWNCGASNGEGLSRVLRTTSTKGSNQRISFHPTCGSTSIRDRTSWITRNLRTRTITRSAARCSSSTG